MMKLKAYQIAVIFFALGIFLVTFLSAYIIRYQTDRKTISEENTRPTEYTSVNIFFSNNFKDPAMIHCDATYPVERSVARLSDNERSVLGEVMYLAVLELLRGPTDYEKEKGYFSSINNGVKIQKITVENGIALVDFNDRLNEDVAGSCRVSAIRSQIEETMKQFPGVLEVKISVDGEFEEILQP